MPTKRRRLHARRLRHADALPIAVRWWLHHGRSLGIAEARVLDMGDHAAWQVSALHFDRPTSPTSSFWTRRHVREAGYGAAMDVLVAAGRCPPDGWREPPSAATCLPLRRR